MSGKRFEEQWGFPTPDDIPEETGCRQFSIPSDPVWFALLMGAVLPLADEKSWYQWGDMTPEEAAAAWWSIIDAAYDSECVGGSPDTLVPFWQTNDGSDAAVEAPAETWYDEVSWWIIEAFLATTVTPGAAITFTTTARYLHLAFKRGGFGALVQILLDEVEYMVLDTYAAGTPLLQCVVDTGDDEEHTLKIVHTGEANEGAVEDEELGGYRVDVIRKNINFAIPNFTFAERYDGTPPVHQVSTDGGETWVDSPDTDRRNQYLLPPREGASARCDAAANLTANLHEQIDAYIAALNLGALAGQLLGMIFSWLGEFGFEFVIISLIEQLISVLLDAGAEDIDDSFTSGVYDALTCYFYVAMTAEGRLTEQGLSEVLDQVYANEVVTVFNVLSALFSAAGPGGLSDIATVGDVEGDCDACSLAFDYVEHFESPLQPYTVPRGDGIHYSFAPNQFGALGGDVCGDAGQCLYGETPGSVYKAAIVTVDFGRDVYIDGFYAFVYTNNSSHQHHIRAVREDGLITYDLPYQNAPGGSGCLGNLTTPTAINARARYFSYLWLTGYTGVCGINAFRLTGSFLY